MLDTTTDAGAYVLGVLWAICSANQEGFWVRHKDPWYVQTVRDSLEFSLAIQTVKSRTGPQARLKVTKADQARALRDLLANHGWANRKALRRPYPDRAIDDRGFVRAWIEIHGTADIARTGRRREEIPRMRVYGNWDLLREINAAIAAGAGLRPRALQRTSNVITKALYYYGTSFRAVAEWLYSECCLSNSGARDRLLSVMTEGAELDEVKVTLL